MPRFASTTTPLAGNATYDSGPLQVGLSDKVTGTCFSDQTGTLTIEHSANGGDNYDFVETIAVTGGTGVGFSKELLTNTVRVRFVNGATPQTAFRLYVRYSSAGSR